MVVSYRAKKTSLKIRQLTLTTWPLRSNCYCKLHNDNNSVMGTAYLWICLFWLKNSVERSGLLVSNAVAIVQWLPKWYYPCIRRSASGSSAVCLVKPWCRVQIGHSQAQSQLHVSLRQGTWRSAPQPEWSRFSAQYYLPSPAAPACALQTSWFWPVAGYELLAFKLTI